MKILVTGAEMNAIRNIMENSEPGSYYRFQEDIKKNPLVSACYIADSHYEIDVDSAYMTDFMQTAAESAGIIVPLLRSAYAAGKVMFQKLDEVVHKHTDKYYRGNIQKAVNHGKETAESVTIVIHNLVRRTDMEKVHKFEDLDPNLQASLVEIYGETVCDMFNTMLNNNR